MHTPSHSHPAQTPAQGAHQREPPGITVEICVDSLALALAAQRGGADRIELCGPLRSGGITPSAGLLQSVRQPLHVPIAVLIRPRTGPFTVSADEFEVMRQDLIYAKTVGADIAVIGILKPDRTVDVLRTQQLVQLAHPMSVTFHRAFDTCPDPFQALQDVLSAGANRILTSGGAGDALEGALSVKALSMAASGRIKALLCGGLSANTAYQAVRLSGVDQVHAALRGCRPKPQNQSPSTRQLDFFSNSVAELKQAVDGNNRL